MEKWFAMVKERLEKLNIADQSDLGKICGIVMKSVFTQIYNQKNSRVQDGYRKLVEGREEKA